MNDIDAMRQRLDELEARLQSYSGAVLSQNAPPMDLLREILELKAKIVRAEIESCEALGKAIRCGVCGKYLDARGECAAGKHDETI